MVVEQKIVSVSELTRKIKLSLETQFPRVWVQGEISNCKQHTSGHIYFTLKDEGAQLSAVLWRSRVPFLQTLPADGMKVVARGALTVYPPRGSYQLDVEQLQPLGIGELQRMFEQLKQKLAAEGLFDARHKKPIPPYPERIGLITSETGAALRDMLHILNRRNSSVEVILVPVRVQGAGAATEIANAIYDCNKYGELDVLILGRGGGSLEDLWAFNEEIVARAIFASKIPIISAVGHEIDFSIADFVADLRAPTPSAAAELVVREKSDIIAEIGNFCYTMENALRRQIQDLQGRIRQAVLSYSFHTPRNLLREYLQRHDELERLLERATAQLLESTHQRQRMLEQRLAALNPSQVLRRGYAIVRKHGKAVTSSVQLIPEDVAEIQFHDGRVDARIERKKQWQRK